MQKDESKTTHVQKALRSLVRPLRIAYDFRDFDCAIGDEPCFPVYIVDSAPDFVSVFLKDVPFKQAQVIVEAINAARI